MVRQLIQQIMSGERDYAAGYAPKHRGVAMEVRRATDYQPDDEGRLSISGQHLGEDRHVIYDLSDPMQEQEAIDRIYGFVARGGRMETGKWRHAEPGSRIYVDASYPMRV